MRRGWRLRLDAPPAHTDISKGDIRLSYLELLVGQNNMRHDNQHDKLNAPLSSTMQQLPFHDVERRREVGSVFKFTFQMLE